MTNISNINLLQTFISLTSNLPKTDQPSSQNFLKHHNQMSKVSVATDLLIILSTCFLLVNTQNIADNPLLIQQCSNSSNYTSSSQFQSNLNLLLSSLVSNGTRNGFFNTSMGAGADRIFGLAQCRFDLSMEDCRTCLNTSTVEILQKCPNQRSAAFRYRYCILQYSDRLFFGLVDMNRQERHSSIDFPYDDIDRFRSLVRTVMDNITTAAASRPSKYMYGVIYFSELANLYGYAECTKDLSGGDCLSCLRNMTSLIPTCCQNTKGAAVFTTTCFIRYEVYPFSNAPAESLSSSPGPSPAITGNKTGKSVNVVAIVVPIVASLLLLAICAYLIHKRIRNKKKWKPAISYKDDRMEDYLQFDLNMILDVTNDFSDANKLGQGGFGAVYKGKLPSGQEIAVKRLLNNSGHGTQEFKNEVLSMYKLQHRNLVRLLGFCLDGEEKLLIYEYICNKSLDRHIFDPARKVHLNWKRRYKIIEGISLGLLYLHEDSQPRIIHRDLKAGNILLDEEMNAKIADFGLAKLFPEDQTRGQTSRIAGTFGYMAPEYVLHGLFSAKSDVFSFGVVLLEIISGYSTYSFHLPDSSLNLLTYAWKLWKEGNILELVDPALHDNFIATEAMRCIHIGLLCVQNKLDLRPTMSSVVLMLKDYSYVLDSPSAPAFISESQVAEDGPRMTCDSDDSTSVATLYTVEGISYPR